jgi:hypothetical protein
LRVADIPQLAALAAPRRLLLAGAVSPQGKKLDEKEMREAFGFTSEVYRLVKAEERLSVRDQAPMDEVAKLLGSRS